MSETRNIVITRGLMRIVRETRRTRDREGVQDVFHVELEGEGVLHSFSTLEMAMFELDAIVASDPPSAPNQ